MIRESKLLSWNMLLYRNQIAATLTAQNALHHFSLGSDQADFSDFYPWENFLYSSAVWVGLSCEYLLSESNVKGHQLEGHIQPCSCPPASCTQSRSKCKEKAQAWQLREKVGLPTTALPTTRKPGMRHLRFLKLMDGWNGLSLMMFATNS